MSTAVLDKIRTERDQVRAAALAIAEGDNFDPSDENYLELTGRAEALDARAASLADLLEKQAAADQLDGRLAKSFRTQEQVREERQRPQTRQTWGELFVRSAEFTDYRGRGSSGIFEITEPDQLQTRELPTGISDLIAAGLTPTPTRVDVSPNTPPTPILDAVTTVTVSTNSIEYVSWAIASGGADVVPEKGAKPPTEYEPTVTPDTLETIAHYTQLTRQLIEDMPAVRSMIDNELQRGVLLKEEDQAATSITGATLPAAQGDTLLGAIRVGIGTVQAAGYQPNAVLLNPADYAQLDIDVMGVTSQGPTMASTYWGLTPIPTSKQTAGTATVGDFNSGVQHFVRSAVALYITDSHADTFLKNVFTLLAERRSKTKVIRPFALCNCTVGAPAVQASRSSKS